MRVATVFAVASAVIGTVTADFHILTANCVEKEFSKRGSLKAEGHDRRAGARPFELGPRAEMDEDAVVDIEKRQKGDKPATWHETDRYSIANLMPSQNYGCNWLQNNEALSYSSLPGDYFHVRNFCGKPLDFYKKGDKWEVWHSGANPGIKYGECYPDPSSFTCDLWVGFYQEKCTWNRRFVCPMKVC